VRQNPPAAIIASVDAIAGTISRLFGQLRARLDGTINEFIVRQAYCLRAAVWPGTGEHAVCKGKNAGPAIGVLEAGAGFLKSGIRRGGW
jgi:hypothetical protein